MTVLVSVTRFSLLVRRVDGELMISAASLLGLRNVCSSGPNSSMEMDLQVGGRYRIKAVCAADMVESGKAIQGATVKSTTFVESEVQEQKA
jgi:hypothetical protein